MNEFSIINKYLSPLSKKNQGALNLKDDIYFNPKKKFAISIDTFVDGLHFIKSKKPSKFLKKILRSSLSDLYCKGVKPKYYFLSFSVNKKIISKKWLKQIKYILQTEQKKFNIILSGGDTTLSTKFTITIVVLGDYKNKPIFRKGAKNGDDIYVTGDLGGSFIGLKILRKKFTLKKLDSYFLKKYYEPELCVKFSKYLTKYAESSIDISDGILQDLNHIIVESKVGAIIDIDLLPICNNTKLIVKKRIVKFTDLVTHGDDYQILFTSKVKNRKLLKKISKITKTKITRIGSIVYGNKIKILNKSKPYDKNFKKYGYIHQFK